jgi:outer membrane protein assembly factor BamE (lipoprotein component of BamABCDE complex)
MRITRRWLASLAMAALVACSPIIDSRGNLPELDDLEKIRVGGTSKEQVTQILGSPSAIATFDPNTWYYISKRTETVVFFRPETLDQKVLTVRFDEVGLVKELVAYDKASGEEVILVNRATPTAGQSLSLFQQLFGNLGRFGDEAPRRRATRTPGGGY